MAATPKSKKRVVSDDHKAAMATGRTEAMAVKNYLDALELTRPKRGRKRTPDSINQRLVKISAELEENPGKIKELTLIQERRDLEDELVALESKVDIDMAPLEKAFIAAAPGYSKRKGISYGAWREIGVSAAMLKAAGISRAG